MTKVIAFSGLLVSVTAACSAEDTASDPVMSTTPAPINDPAPTVDPAPVTPADTTPVEDPAPVATVEPAPVATMEPAPVATTPAAAGGAPVTGPPVDVEPPPPPPAYCDDKTPTPIPYVVTTDYVPSGWFGDFDDILAVPAPDCNEGLADPGDMPITDCVVFDYSGAMANGMGFAGVAFQNPANNWGEVPGLCIDPAATSVEFWARSSLDGVTVKFGAASFEVTTTLTTEWQMFSVPLLPTFNEATLGGGVASGFSWSAAALDFPEGGRLYMANMTWQ